MQRVSVTIPAEGNSIGNTRAILGDILGEQPSRGKRKKNLDNAQKQRTAIYNGWEKFQVSSGRTANWGTACQSS